MMSIKDDLWWSLMVIIGHRWSSIVSRLGEGQMIGRPIAKGAAALEDVEGLRNQEK